MLKGKLKVNIGSLSITLIAVVALLVVCDLLTKHFEEAYDWNFVLIKGWVEFSPIRNQGCAFSFLNDNPAVGQPILITLTFIMLAVLIGVFIFLPERFKVLKIAVALVVAGAIGNLADRLMLREVRDFIGLNMLLNGNLVSCNLADFYIVIGAVLAIADLLFFNEYAVLPLTRSAKAAQKNHEKDKTEEGDGESE